MEVSVDCFSFVYVSLVNGMKFMIIILAVVSWFCDGGGNQR